MANQIVQSQSVDGLPALIDRASAALSSARTSAEVLEARDMARIAYDAAQSVSRIVRAKDAHDEVIGAVYRAQADAALIEARAKMRLADEYDAAQDRGEVAKLGDNLPSVVDVNAKPVTAADIGIRRDEIHEARKLRDAEAADPGKAERVMSDMLARGEEPTKTKLKRSMVGAEKAADQPDDDEVDRKLRRAFRKLTAQAQEDDWVGLKRSLHEEKGKSRKLKAEIDMLKQRLKEISQAGQSKTIADLQAKCFRLKDAGEGHQAAAARLQRQVNAQKAEIDRLKKAAENQVFQL